MTRVHGFDRCMRRMRVEEWDNAKTENEWMAHSQHEQLLDIDGEGTRYGGCVLRKKVKRGTREI